MSTETSAERGVRIVPLGGLGEIGANCLCLEQDGERLVVDCGATFPYEDYGVDYLHPRFDHLLDAPDRLVGVVLTHGHEDHIGALAALARALPPENLTFYGRAHALALARLRLEDEGIRHSTDGGVTLREVSAGEPFAVGSFSCELVNVTHSIPQAAALAVRTRAGLVVHSGDFKLDPAPGDGELTDEARLRALGDEGVALLMSDSTNVLREGHTGSERLAAETLDRIIGAAPGRVLVGLFSSNLHRLRAMGDACMRHGRRLILMGRSVRKHVAVGRKLGILDWPSDLVGSPSQGETLPPSSVAYVVSGTQGEWRGALGRVARGVHPELAIEPGDLVLLSSRIIPGHERSVFKLINQLLRQGADVRTGRDTPGLHVSGHACRQEQERMIEWLRPRCFVPLHGTLKHLRQHAELARDLGVAQTEVVLDGDCLRLLPGDDGASLQRDGQVPAGKISTNAGLELDEALLRERRRIGRGGVVTVTLVAGTRPGVAVNVHGVPCYEEVVSETERIARQVAASGVPDEQVAERARRLIRQRLEELLGYRPTVSVTRLELDP